VGVAACALLAVACAEPNTSIHEAIREAKPESRARAPAEARRLRTGKLRFAVIGDFGEGTEAQRMLAGRMCRWRRRHPFKLVVTTGDNIYPDGSQGNFESKFFGPYSCLLNRGVTWRASLGNHDYETDRGRAELDTPAFGLRSRNYVFGRRRVRFVVADLNQLDVAWLRKATRARPEIRWTIVVFHHPVYSPGRQHGSTRGFAPALPRLFRRRGVDLVLNGHDHIYSVSRPLGGIRYVVTGGGGAPLYDCTTTSFTQTCRERHHFLYVVAGPHKIRVRAVGIRGAPFARFRTNRRR
jgi:hypothetical protein